MNLVLTRGMGSKIPKIWLTSFVYGPKNDVCMIKLMYNECEACNFPTFMFVVTLKNCLFEL